MEIIGVPILIFEIEYSNIRNSKVSLIIVRDFSLSVTNKQRSSNNSNSSKYWEDAFLSRLFGR